MASVAAEASGGQAADAVHLTDLPQHVLAAIAALLCQRDRAALASCSRELAAASWDQGWWHTVEASLGSQSNHADSLGEWLRRRRPAVASLRLHFAARDPCSRRAIELQLPEDPPLPLQELRYHQPVAPPHLVQAVLQRCPAELTSLSLAECSLCDIPAAVRVLSCLQRLDLSHNRFEDLRPLACLTTLTQLSLERVGLRDVPPELRRLSALRWLSLRHNPEIRGSWAPLAPLQHSLTRLDISGTGLAGAAELPDELAALTSLRWLDASSNGVRSWRQLSALQHLTHLALRSCQLSELPAEALAATGLQSLDLSSNQQLSEDGLGRLSALHSLTCLNLSYCSVSLLPPSLSALTSLRQLLLAGNGFVRGLGVLEGLPLTWLDVRGCFYAGPPSPALRSIPGPSSGVFEQHLGPSSASAELAFDLL